MRTLLPLCFCVLPAALGAQPSRYSFEGLVDRRRWLYPAQHEATTPWLLRGGWSVRIDSTTRARRGASASTRVALSLDPRGSAVVVIGHQGSIDAMEYIEEPLRDPTDRDSLRAAGWDAEAVDVWVRSFPLVFGTAPVGSSRRVPVRIRIERSLYARQLTGSFVTRRLADTVIDGVTMHQLRDVGEVTIATRTSRAEYTRSGIRRDTRTLRGRWIARDVRVAMVTSPTSRN